MNWYRFKGTVKETKIETEGPVGDFYHRLVRGHDAFFRPFVAIFYMLFPGGNEWQELHM